MEEPVCPPVNGANQTCRVGYHYPEANGRRHGNYALCADAITQIPVLPASYVLCGHEAFLTPEQRAALAAEEAREAAEASGVPVPPDMPGAPEVSAEELP